MTSQERITELCNVVPSLNELYNSRVRHYTIKAHTLNVINQFEKYYSNNFTEIDIDLFRLVLLLHDIGKSIAHKNGNRNNQYVDTLNIITKYKQSLSISDESLILFESLLKDDSLGLYMQGKVSLETAYDKIILLAQYSKLETTLFFYLLSVYYQCDVASYTVDAGGLKFLEYLFEYSNGSKIYSEDTKLLKFFQSYQSKYDMLSNKIKCNDTPKKEIPDLLAKNITFIKGNIFNTSAQVIVNTVNCVGVMGKGIALVFKLRYPQMFDIYKEYCAKKYIGIGKLWLYKGEANAPWVLNFPTKFHWKYPSKIEYLEQGLLKFTETYKEKGITSIAFPLLGTHNGGLDRAEVLQLMNQYLGKCDVKIEIYEYDPLAPDDLFEYFKTKWNSIKSTNRKEITGIRTQRQIDTITEALNSDMVKSMIALIEYKGIGLKTMEKCFNMVMNAEQENTLRTDLFD